jgi:cell division protein FtsN
MINFDSRNKQSGGTILGFIFGLIVGLGVAVGVAMVINRTPVPFLNKLGKQDKIPELTPGQSADPNKPLYGNKGPAKEAAKDFAKDADAAPAADADKPGPVKPAEKPKAADKPEPKSADSKPAEPKAPDNKAADGKDAKTAAAKADAVEEKWIYYLQAGAFREQADAESTKAKLALAGFEAGISERPSDNGPLYRVRIGPFNQVEAMNRARVKLSDNGVDVAVIRIAK